MVLIEHSPCLLEVCRVGSTVCRRVWQSQRLQVLCNSSVTTAAIAAYFRACLGIERLTFPAFWFSLTIGKQMLVRIQLLEYRFPSPGSTVVLFMQGSLQLANRVSIPHLVLQSPGFYPERIEGLICLCLTFVEIYIKREPRAATLCLCLQACWNNSTKGFKWAV